MTGTRSSEYKQHLKLEASGQAILTRVVKTNILERGITMESINLYDFQIDFIKDLLREYQKSKHSDIDTRMMARDIDEFLTAQFPDYCPALGKRI